MPQDQEVKKPAKKAAAKPVGTETAASTDQKRARVIRGVVVSDKMNKTRVIEIKRTLRHRLYQKGLVRSNRLFIHDEKNESKVGDKVLAVLTRPLSRNKSHRLYKIVEKRAQA